MIGNSQGWNAVRTAIAQVAPTRATVLILGETGTGKEQVARAIHQQSPRVSQPFVPVSCVALSPTLMTSELFGHEAGAFTGANRRRIGRFEQADHGTLFLDEIGELPHEAQTLLLRVLQERQFERVGGETLSVDVRLITATNCSLWEAVEHHRFRADLYYRLHVFPITLPPLRERREDIPLLIEHYLPVFSAQHGGEVTRLSAVARRHFQTHDWPGNIRELLNILERGVIASSGDELAFDPAWLHGATASESARTWAAQERQRILDALRSAEGRIYGPGGAAQRLGLKPTTLYGKMKKHGIHKSLNDWQ